MIVLGPRYYRLQISIDRPLIVGSRPIDASSWMAHQNARVFRKANIEQYRARRRMQLISESDCKTLLSRGSSI